MRSKKDTFLSNKGKRIIIVIFAFILLNLVSYVIDPYSSYWISYLKRSVLSITEDLALSFVFCLLISESSICISNKLNNSISWTEKPLKRLIIETALNLVIIFVSLAILDQLYRLMDEAETCIEIHSADKVRGFFQWIVVSIIIAFMIIGINTCNYLIVSWKNAAMKAAALDQLAVEAELQSLKLQIDPHFVFNNLSVLSELILFNQQLGYEYAENFSKIYRYMLVNSKKDIILLEEELKFLNSYMFLIKNRIGDGVAFEVNIDQASKQLYLPPLTLQLLVENALKHNKTNKKNPLKISIYNTDEQALIVENILLPIENQLESSGIGIQNIIRRYDLLWQKQPEIIKDETTFKVKIPLIKQ
ncbi:MULTISPECIES: histidine kinase [unclassified Arcicella]|uniref:sensor histidine kinase n=1 Tax=unclassified Arcicella TaxID=2644986 RepID=UPI0028542923|nr:MULTISPECIES: histidine kinase [unclassified Arcicella]MDR6562393.1 sensor histidine kinase YesM [Arcicella sp. BE51]MDR6812287.1 sensor histidine kinase YesM [Arcicella sp. BE140]MDR6823618.1 sensor histidine kinase YesM [Arcicella sp. BE139]